jgi:hypothetical protein
VRFNDGDHRWLPYTADLYETVQFGEFILLHPELHVLALPTANVAKFITYVKSQSIADLHLPDTSGRRPTRSWMSPITLGLTVFVDLRFWSDDGHNWYFGLGLPHALSAASYVVPITYTDWGSRQRTVAFTCELFEYSDTFNTYQVFAHGSQSTFNPSTMILVDAALVCDFPDILPSENRARLLRKYRGLVPRRKKEEGRKTGVA